MEKPILFNTEMVRAILDGRKTQTRRLIRPQPGGQLSYIFGGSHPGKWTYMSRSEAKAWDVDESVIHEEEGKFWTPPCHGDDVLYVRETWKQATGGTAGPGLFDTFLFKADEPQDTTGLMVEGCWHPSIHMPRKAARIFLKVNRVRVERLQDISYDDVQAEGMDMDAWYEYDEWQHQTGDGLAADGAHVIYETMRGFFGHKVWDATMQSLEQYEKYGWDANPWVWVIEFERLEGKHDEH